MATDAPKLLKAREVCEMLGISKACPASTIFADSCCLTEECYLISALGTTFNQR